MKNPQKTVKMMEKPDANCVFGPLGLKGMPL